MMTEHPSFWENESEGSPRHQHAHHPSAERHAPHTKKVRPHSHHIHDDFFYFAMLSVPFVGTQFMAPFIVEERLLLPTAEVIVAFFCLVSAILLIYIFWWPNPGPVHAVRASAFDVTSTKIPKKLDTIVIGSGSGGATCANLLAQSGKKVLVLEQHPTATGGCTHSFREKNCEWDTGLHYTSKAMSCPTERPGAIMNFMSRGMQEWTPLTDPYDEIVFPAEPDSCVLDAHPNVHRYPYWSGLDATVDGILKRTDPEETEANGALRERVRNYFLLCQDINAGFTALGLSRILPSWLNRVLTRSKVDRLMAFASLTVRDVQHAVLNLGYTPDQILNAAQDKTLPKAPNGPDPNLVIRRLKGVLCHPIGDYAVQPREATMAAHGVTMAHYMNGASYTVGATQRISVRLTSMVRNFGGDVFCNATVQGILMEQGKAVGVRVCSTTDLDAHHADPETVPAPKSVEIRARHIVCATSIYNLYQKLLPQEKEDGGGSSAVAKFKDPAQRTVRQSHGHIFLFCKLRGSPDELQLPKHNLWYFHNYDLDSAFDAYFEHPTDVRPPTVYIGFPCTKDVTWNKRFPNCSNCILISDGLYEWFEKWADQPNRQRGEGYLKFKNQLTRHLLDILFECVPQLTKDKVEFHHLGTPLTEVTYLGSYRGGSYGTKCVTAMFDPVNRDWTTTPHTHVPGLYLAGSDAFLPSVVGAMYGGGLGACAVLGHVGTLRLAVALLSHMAHHIRQDHGGNGKSKSKSKSKSNSQQSIGRLQAYREAIRCFLK